MGLRGKTYQSARRSPCMSLWECVECDRVRVQQFQPDECEYCARTEFNEYRPYNRKDNAYLGSRAD